MPYFHIIQLRFSFKHAELNKIFVLMQHNFNVMKYEIVRFSGKELT